ncbi:MAG: hypothetical protein ABFD51_12770 [Anaerolineaceae bacterium]
MTSISPSNRTTRIGIHYFTDDHHYREQDAEQWIPQLHDLGLSWLVLTTTTERAIPEYFINALVEANIKPILHFKNISLSPTLTNELSPLLEPYAKWGVQHIILFDRPNCRNFWQPQAWMQSDLVERFLDGFIPLAELALKSGITPVFPPLEPAGDYWDTAFLREALQGILRRETSLLCENLTLSAYVVPGANPLAWGIGGPQNWPGAKPYYTPPDQQDQCGFYIFSWYQSLGQAIFDKTLPMILLESNTGSCNPMFGNAAEIRNEHDSQCLAIARLLTETYESSESSLPEANPIWEPIPEEVLCFNYYLLSAASESDESAQAWFQPDGNTLPMVDMFKQWRKKIPAKSTMKSIPQSRPVGTAISHYVLIPDCHEELLAYYMDTLRGYFLKHKPALGFSVDEALLADKITVIGDIQQYPAGTLEKLLSSGCQVEHLF